MDVSAAGWVVIGVVVVAGATIQGAIGFGMNVVAVPVLALVEPDVLPVAAIVFGFPISIAMVRHERAAIDRAGLTWLTLGRVPGSLLGAWIVTVASPEGLQVAIGLMVLAFVVTSAAAPALPVHRSTQLAAGMVSGTTGTAAGIGGPPIALLYQHRAGPVVRSTLSATFLVGTVLSFTVLLVSGSVTADGVVVGLAGMPAVLAGTRLGRRFHDLLDQGWLRPAVLAFCAVAALVVLVEALG